MVTFLEYSYLDSTLLIYGPSQTILSSALEDPIIVCAVRTSHATMSAAPVDCSPWKESSCVKSLPGVPSLRHTLSFTSRSFTPSNFVLLSLRIALAEPAVSRPILPRSRGDPPDGSPVRQAGQYLDSGPYSRRDAREPFRASARAPGISGEFGIATCCPRIRNVVIVY